MENTQRKTNETLKPEQMESGKWYVVFTKDLFTEWLIKFDSIQENRKVIVSKCYDLTDNYDWTSPCNSSLSNKHDIKSIRPATNEEVLKYFPDEKFENVSLINEVNNTQVTEQQNQIEPEKVEVDWKAKYNELDAKFDALADKYSRLEFYDKELEKVSSQQSKLITNLRNELKEKENQEKVYFYLDKERNHWRLNIDKQIAIDDSENHKEIYESVKIGIKKSILVNE